MAETMTVRCESVDSPLRELADRIVRLSDEQASTPVLVLPTYLSLREPFFVELAGQLKMITGRPIRFDCCRPRTGVLSALTSRVSRLRFARMSRRLSQFADAAIVLTASIARPGGSRRDLVVGLCDETLHLPSWTTAIRIG